MMAKAWPCPNGCGETIIIAGQCARCDNSPTLFEKVCRHCMGAFRTTVRQARLCESCKIRGVAR